MIRHHPSSYFSYCFPCFSLCQYWATFSCLTFSAGSHHSVFARSGSFASFLYLISAYQTFQMQFVYRSLLPETFLIFLPDSSSSLTYQLFTCFFTNCIMHRIVIIHPYWNGSWNSETEVVYSENLRLIRIQWVLNFLHLSEIVEQRI